MFWALRRMGHEVVVVGAAPGPWIPWAEDRNLDEFEWKPDVAFHYEPERLCMLVESEDVLGKLQTPPDLVLQMDIRFAISGKPPCPNVLYAVDNHVGPYGAQETFDHIFLAHSIGYMTDLPNAHHLPCAHDPAHQYVIDESMPRPHDVAMIGVAYDSRIKLVNYLKKNGINVLAMTGAIYGDYNLIYNQSKIALVSSVNGDLPMRVFENMAQGCLVVTDRQKDLAACGFVENVHYLGYSHADECLNKIMWALTRWNSPEIRKMIDASREAVKAHTWETRAKTILETVGLN
jgi:glycosyltransferase involved in cell wall biosynthesis